MNVRLEENYNSCNADCEVKDDSLDSLKKRVIEVALKVSKNNDGALFVIGNNSDYDLHFPNFFENNNISIFDEGVDKVLVSLAAIDGAVIIDNLGFIRAYGARILNTATLKGFGTRHSAARGASLRDDFVILVSEEDSLVRVFKEGNIAMEISDRKYH